MSERVVDKQSARGDTDKPLRRDVRMLGLELGQVLKRHGRPGLYELVEGVRGLAKLRRGGDAEADLKLRALIASLDVETLDELVRAISCYFDLANLAEDRHRIRILRQRERELHPAPRNESIGAAIDSLRRELFTPEQAQALLDKLDIELVFTAHPTEAKRRTVRNTLRRLREDLIELDRGHLVPRERERLITRVRTDLDCLWETDSLRPRKPTVLEEVRRSLFVAEPLWQVVPTLYGTLRRSLAANYPGHTFRAPRFLRFGSWIGGDRDGNPFVTPEVTRQTLVTLRQAALRKHAEQGKALAQVLSVSTRRAPLTPALGARLDEAVARWPEVADYVSGLNPHERYRHWLAVIHWRLEHAARADPFEPLHDAAYRRASELRDDLTLMAESLRAGGHGNLADGQLQEWLDLLDVFGFHFARLDIREDARRLQDAVAEMWPLLGLGGVYASADEESRQAMLIQPLAGRVEGRVDLAGVAEATRHTVGLFMLLHRAAKTFGPDVLGTAIVSMTHDPSDVLAVLWLLRLGAAMAGDDEPAALMPLVPLFETIDDLRRADAILGGLFAQPDYRAHVEACGGVQVCMVGYSDSTKDGGYLAANWNLYRAEDRLAEFCRKRGVKLTLFHGRGGALGRGGGPAARGILSLPPNSVDGRIRITEQGEVLAERYDDPEIAFRHLEQVTWATMLVSSRTSEAPPKAWVEALDAATEASYQAYRELVEDPGFVRYFAEATPIDTIETLPIGSRPSRRQAGRQERTLAGLRAIPYTFAWTQNRHLLTGFYGLGAGLQSAAGGDWTLFRTMYSEWRFFRAVIDNAELALAKCDLAIAREYAQLVEDREVGDRLYARFRDEFEAARRAVLAITGREEVLAGVAWLQRSIRVRNPSVDPLNFIQIELTRRLRDLETENGEAERLSELLRLTVQGVAAGLRTTG